MNIKLPEEMVAVPMDFLNQIRYDNILNVFDVESTSGTYEPIPEKFLSSSTTTKTIHIHDLIITSMPKNIDGGILPPFFSDYRFKLSSTISFRKLMEWYDYLNPFLGYSFIRQSIAGLKDIKNNNLTVQHEWLPKNPIYFMNKSDYESLQDDEFRKKLIKSVKEQKSDIELNALQKTAYHFRLNKIELSKTTKFMLSLYCILTITRGIFQTLMLGFLFVPGDCIYSYIYYKCPDISSRLTNIEVKVYDQIKEEFITKPIEM